MHPQDAKSRVSFNAAVRANPRRPIVRSDSLNRSSRLGAAVDPRASDAFSAVPTLAPATARLPGAHDFLEPASASFGSRRVTWCGGALPQACGEFRGGSYQLGRRLRPAEEVGLDLPHPPAAELDVAAAVTLVAPPSPVRKRSRKCSPRSIASSSRGLRWRRSRCRDQANQPSPSRHVVATRRCVWQAGPAARAKIRIGPSNARRQASAQAPTQPS